MLYFEVKAEKPRLSGFVPGGRYRWAWFDPRSGRWTRPMELSGDAQGEMPAPPFPGGAPSARGDWAAKLTAVPKGP